MQSLLAAPKARSSQKGLRSVLEMNGGCTKHTEVIELKEASAGRGPGSLSTSPDSTSKEDDSEAGQATPASTVGSSMRETGAAPVRDPRRSRCRRTDVLSVTPASQAQMLGNSMGFPVVETVVWDVLQPALQSHKWIQNLVAETCEPSVACCP